MIVGEAGRGGDGVQEVKLHVIMKKAAGGTRRNKALFSHEILYNPSDQLKQLLKFYYKLRRLLQVQGSSSYLDYIGAVYLPFQ